MRDEYSLPNPEWEGGYLGGDLRGVLDRIDYLRSLNLNTILMYPPFANDREPFFEYLASGYRVTDWQEVDRNIGTRQQLAETVRAFHHGIPALRLLLDLPIGMAGREHPWTLHQLEYEYHFRPWGGENIADEPMDTLYGPVDTAYGMGINNHLLGSEDHTAVYGTLVDDVMIWLARNYGIDYTEPGSLFEPGLDEAFHAWFKDVARLRAERVSLRRGDLTWLTRNATYLSHARVHPSETILAAFHIDGVDDRTETLEIGAAGIHCESVRNLLDPADTRNELSGSGAAQVLHVTHHPWEPKLLLCE